MTPTPEGREVAALLERAADDIMCPNCISAKNYCDDCLSLKVELRKTAAALSVPAPEPQPVAWKVEERTEVGGPIHNTFWFEDDPERAARIRERAERHPHVSIVPLYAAAPRERTEGEPTFADIERCKGFEAAFHFLAKPPVWVVTDTNLDDEEYEAPTLAEAFAKLVAKYAARSATPTEAGGSDGR